MRRMSIAAELLFLTLGLGFRGGCFESAVFAAAQQNSQPGEVRFSADNEQQRDSGVWIDGKYFGYVKELKGDKKVL